MAYETAVAERIREYEISKEEHRQLAQTLAQQTLVEKQQEYLNRRRQLDRESDHLQQIKLQTAQKVFNWSTMQYEYSNGVIPEEQPGMTADY